MMMMDKCFMYVVVVWKLMRFVWYLMCVVVIVIVFV